MVFSSAIFLFIFLPVVFGICLLPLSLRVKNGVLVAASLFFYAFGEPVYVFLMIASTLFNYLAGVILGKIKTEGTGKAVLVLAVLVNVALIGVFKYAGFLVTTCNFLFHRNWPVPEIPLPIGISFFTFQAMSYVIDVFRDRATVQKSFWKLFLYISFFPQLIAGPIIRYHDVASQLTERTMETDQVVRGMQRLIRGLFKKLWIANTMGSMADAVYGLPIGSYHSLVGWLGAVCYTLQIYYDFSGYSDMAIGLAGMFGFSFGENFDHPYAALDIREFWRKWHISLSSWFKEYVYIPLGGSHRGKVRTECNKLIVFALTGIWHGADWTFVMWGLFHGLMVVLEDTVLPVRKLSYKLLRNLYVWLVVVVAFVFFRADGVSQAFAMFHCMFAGFDMNSASVSFLSGLLSFYHVLAVTGAVLFSYPVSAWIGKKLPADGKKRETVAALSSIVMLVLCMIHLASAAYNPFIYFRF